jgi:hypothetical protein
MKLINILKEIGEASISPLSWEKDIYNGDYSYNFNVDINGQPEMVEVSIYKISEAFKSQPTFPLQYKNIENIYTIGYSISEDDEQFAKTDAKTLLTILSTIVDITKDFINDKQPELIILQGSPKNSEDDGSKKGNIYKTFILKQLKIIPNYKFDSYNKWLILIKN